MEDSSDRLMFAEDRDALHGFKSPKGPQYSLVSSLDAISLLRRDLKGMLDGADLDRRIFIEKDSATLGLPADLPSHAILDRGRVVGLWEFDTSTNTIAWTSFVK